jgi:hypothetical protein
MTSRLGRGGPPQADRLPCGRHVDDLIEQVAEGHGGDLTEHQRACTHCRAFLAETATLWEPVSALAHEELRPPADLFDKVITRVRSSASRHRASVGSARGGSPRRPRPQQSHPPRHCRRRRHPQPPPARLCRGHRWNPGRHRPGTRHALRRPDPRRCRRRTRPRAPRPPRTCRSTPRARRHHRRRRPLTHSRKRGGTVGPQVRWVRGGDEGLMHCCHQSAVPSLASCAKPPPVARH